MQTKVDVDVVVNNLSLSNVYKDVQCALKEARNPRHLLIIECVSIFQN